MMIVSTFIGGLSMKRKCLSLSLCLSLCLSLAAPALAAEKPVFSDVPAGSWFEKGAATYAQRGIMVGTGRGSSPPIPSSPPPNA